VKVCARRQKEPERGVTAFCVILTVALLAILAHSLIAQALINYRAGAQLRDTIVLQQLTDSALAQALYCLNRSDRAAAAAPIREPFGATATTISNQGNDLLLRVDAFAPNAEMPRLASRTAFRLARDAKGRWGVAAAENEPAPWGSLSTRPASGG